LRILAKRNLTLKESLFFSSYILDKKEREKILGRDRDSWTIKEVFRSDYKFETFFSSSVNRLDSLWQEPLSSMLGNAEGINFIQAVSEGYVILVNLSPYRLTDEESQLLGILTLSQIIQAVDSLVGRGWSKVFYLYIDEAGRFATPQIDTLLSYKRKSGLRLVLAHHFNDQFADKKVFNSIVNNARIKVMFDTPNPGDRLSAMKAMGYGGDITPTMASFANQNLPKQHAIIKKNKDTPVRVKIPDVKEYPPVTKEFINEITDRPYYASRPLKQDNDSLKLRTLHERKPARKAPLSKRTPKKDIRKDQQTTPETEERRPLKF
jgi:hypothetical protein